MELQKIRKTILLLACLLIGWSSLAGSQPQVDDSIARLAEKYENVKGVETNIFKKGLGLELIKSMLKKEFGKDFMKGVTSIVMIEYTEADSGTCMSIRKDIEAFSTILQEIDLKELGESEPDSFAKCYIVPDGTDTPSGFLVISEDDETKMAMYMGGKIIL